jgi:hypothetical protein
LNDGFKEELNKITFRKICFNQVFINSCRLYAIFFNFIVNLNFQYDCKSNIKRKGKRCSLIVSSITVYDLKVMGEKTLELF